MPVPSLAKKGGQTIVSASAVDPEVRQQRGVKLTLMAVLAANQDPLCLLGVQFSNPLARNMLDIGKVSRLHLSNYSVE